MKLGKTNILADHADVHQTIVRIANHKSK